MKLYDLKTIKIFIWEHTEVLHSLKHLLFRRPLNGGT